MTIRERNQAIRARYKTGESLSDLARLFGLSPQRVYQIVRGKHK
ncbi:helix-turn-helix domain-containing protein [Chloroflexota bacterium]